MVNWPGLLSRWGVVLVLLLSVACRAEETETGTSQPEGVLSNSDEAAILRFERRSIVDTAGFGYEAFGMLVPKDWAFEGGLEWDFPNGVPNSHLHFTVRSSDGAAIVEHHPPANFVWATDPMLLQGYRQQGTTILQPMPLEEFFRNVYLPQARGQTAEQLQIRSVRPLPEEAERDRRMNEYLINQVFHSISPFMMLPRFGAEAALVETEYLLDSRPVVETFLAVLSLSTFPMPGYPSMVTEHWSVNVTAFRVFREKAEEMAEIMPVLMRSAQANPRWLVDSTRLAATLTRQALRQQQAIFDRMQQIARTQSEISDMIVDSYTQRSHTMDRIFDNYSQAVRGVDSYRDPSRDMQPVELPLGYDQVWTDGSGYVLTNDPAFDPTKLEGRGVWSRMEPAQR